MEAGDGIEAESTTEKLIRDLLGFAAREQTGELVCDITGSEATGRIVLQCGRVVDAEHEGEWGAAAFKKLLTKGLGDYRLVEGERPDHPARIAESTVALLIDSLQGISEERRGRRER
jgi:hypothetical protein